jgi:uncharacterized RDD family membrane protein YckC
MKTKNLMNEMLKRALAVWGGVMLCAASPVCSQPTNAEEAVAQATNALTAEAAMPEAAATNVQPSEPEHGIVKLRGHRSRHGAQPIVVFGQHVEVKSNETVEAVVIIGGSADVKGKVTDAVVVIGGKADVTGEVQDVVAVGGSIVVHTGAQVKGDAVAVCGSLEIQDGVSVGGDAVSVFGRQLLADGAEVKGERVNVLSGLLPVIEPLQKWFVECVLKLRPLAPSVGWVWVVAGVFLLLYVLVALAFPRPVQSCLDELTRRPATTFLIGLLTKMLIPVVTFILLITGIGVFIVPFLSAAVIFAGILGKVALLQYFGQQLSRQFTGGAKLSPLVTLLIGSALITVLYIVPVLGLLVFLATGMWALGAAVMAMFGGMRREMPERPQPPTTPPPAAYAAAAPMNMTGMAPAAGIAPMPVGTAAGSSPASEAPPAFGAPLVAPVAPAVTPEAWTLPRAGIWERMGAAFLDVILVSILGGVVGGPPLGFLVALAYFAGMWAWKGTTIGGIVLKLKVVRLDGQPITFPVALVRGLAAAFSVVVLFLGFLWIAWDKEKQGWHDKIAGTAVVRLPRTQSLVCF